MIKNNLESLGRDEWLQYMVLTVLSATTIQKIIIIISRLTGASNLGICSVVMEMDLLTGELSSI